VGRLIPGQDGFAPPAVVDTVVVDAPSAAGDRAAKRPAPWASRARLAWIGAYALAGVVLFLCYLRVSGTQTVSSDGGSNALEAWDMLHGNLLLRGWTLTDVSFYTTELPEYILVELIRGLGPAVVHTAAAFTYTLLVLLAGLLAKGRATGREGVARVLIGSGIMLAPQLGNPVFVLLLVPDHVGTGVPMLLIFLVLDRAGRRWWVPPVVGLMLVWATTGDRLVIAAAVVPIVLVCGLRILRAVLADRPLRMVRFEAGLAGAAIVAVGISLLVADILGRLGGYSLIPLGTHLAKFSGLANHFRLTGDGVLDLYGADFIHAPLGPQTGIAVIHLAGLGLAAWALCRALRRFFRCDDLLVQVLAVGILADLAAFVFSTLPRTIWDTRQISALLPFGAVLAGRLLAGDLLRVRLVPALAVGVLACYTAALGFDTAQHDVPAWDQSLADWLVAHDLKYGLSNYYEGNITTLDSGGRVHLVAVHWGADKSVPRAYQSAASWYDPQLHYANFVVNTGVDQPPAIIPSGDLLKAFGRPAKVYHDGPYTILVWNKNLLADLGRPPLEGPGNVKT
jgi:hypothetical protein